MRNILRIPLRNISPEKISDLQDKYPNASVKIELNDTPVGWVKRTGVLGFHCNAQLGKNGRR